MSRNVALADEAEPARDGVAQISAKPGGPAVQAEDDPDQEKGEETEEEAPDTCCLSFGHRDRGGLVALVWWIDGERAGGGAV